jgi:thymidylate synthase (FAD)
MGTDLTVANAARVSYDKKSDTLTDGDVKLINFLAREGHTSPFRHCSLQFEVYSPLMVARQHFKYIVGSSILEATGDNMEAWNESSRRYITEKSEFYFPAPDEWRSAPENSKQGSGPVLPAEVGIFYTKALRDHAKMGEQMYEDAMAAGIAPEQARLFLPAYAMYVRYYWSASLASVCHFLSQRLAHDSQAEIQQYAKAVLELAKEQFPLAVAALVQSEEAST